MCDILIEYFIFGFKVLCQLEGLFVLINIPAR